MDLPQAQKLLLGFIDEGSIVKAGIEEGDQFLFIAHRPDPLEGQLDPFFSVDKKTKKVRDFSPQDYPNPLEILNKLKSVYTDS